MDIKCPHCGEEYIAEANEYGKFVKCETCGEGFIVGTSATKELGKAVQNIKNAAGMAIRTAYEKANKVDWKKQGEFVNSAMSKAVGVMSNSIRRQSGETGMKHMTRLAIVGTCLILATQVIDPILSYLVRYHYYSNYYPIYGIVRSIIKCVGLGMILMFFIALYRRQKT